MATTSKKIEISFIKETSDKQFTNSFTGRGNSYRYVAVNSLGEYGCLPGETQPYAPIGGIKVLKEVLDILVWKEMRK